jgi:hypothetical protein
LKTTRTERAQIEQHNIRDIQGVPTWLVGDTVGRSVILPATFPHVYACVALDRRARMTEGIPRQAREPYGAIPPHQNHSELKRDTSRAMTHG